MILFRSLKGWGLKGLVKMLFYEIQFVLKDGFSTFKNIGHKSKNHSNIDNYNIPTPAVYIKEIEKVFQNFLTLQQTFNTLLQRKLIQNLNDERT